MEQTPDKAEKSGVPSVAIDGSRIRSIREANKLTQLYVASVVGVTTDTISRWENNRYPSIKRDNAEKLAAALEVELGEIQRQEPEPAAEPQAQPSPRHRRLTLLGTALGVLLTAMLALGFFLSRKPSLPSAVRWTPPFAAPGEIIPVRITISRHGPEPAGFILKEKLPEGWQLVSSAPASSGANLPGAEIKWLLPGSTPTATVAYTVQIPLSPPPEREIRLKGEVVVRGAGTSRTETVSGSSGVRVGSQHWADSNGDGRIDDDEIMPAYYVCEEMKGLGLDWKTIEAIWSSKGYRWDKAGGFVPVR